MPAFKSNKQTIKYIKEKGRSLPIHECFATEGWQENGMGTFVISRKMPGGNYAIALFLLDIFCLGVKEAFYRVNLDDDEYEEFKTEKLPQGEPDHFDPHHFHNLIYGAIDFAEEYGFQPGKGFEVAEYMLDPDMITDKIDDLTFGHNGIPHYMQGPMDSNAQAARIINKLQETAGENNYYYTVVK